MMLRHLAAVILLLSLTSAAAAQSLTQPERVQPVQPTAPAKPEDIVVKGNIPDADKKVCKAEAATGSIISKRICRPKWQWELERQRAIAALEQLDRERRAEQHARDNRGNN